MGTCSSNPVRYRPDGVFLFKTLIMNLKEYYDSILAHQRANPISCTRPQPDGINTLWVPQWSSNRTAGLNINHQVNEFDEAKNMAYGENGNCMTPYTIIEVPMWFTEAHLQIVAEILCKEMGKPADYPTFRVLKAVRIEAIKRIISTLPAPTS